MSEVISAHHALASRLELFSSRIGEVPPQFYDDMSCAVCELTNCVMTVTRGASLKRMSPQDRLLAASAALRAASPNERESQDLEAIEASVDELFNGLEMLNNASIEAS